ncbi:3-oxoacyl-[acyl-carrier protein] reductase [Paenibacillus sp. UNCCL117]|uniref:SDR family NAD(P)-dependent oxidoreductase n=1 Tax=unclassified Paenibacillus TaxID=185978 RepID=UPI00087FBF91|nr:MULTISPECIES: SDR family oxidoreductase [unclassified Paenibacillus]SDC95133.1 3-oxoacyl-[acyl-carrier protein] reductase [Paenibacillus sp. cl123]SFW29960.1 3-oxoacyl-[acyl-carrier protein] reductase [Paenibacillus sp. UNCCL117]
MNHLQGKVAFVSGGGRGIGAASAVALAQLGAKVAVNYVRQADSAQAVVDQIREAGGEAMLAKADVRDPEQVKEALASIREAWGDIDILVNNAHMSFVMKPLVEMQWEELAQKMNDEMKAAFTLTKAVLPAMIERKNGRIIYISSDASVVPLPYMAAHGSAKAALDTFAKYVALESGPYGVTANVVSPGLVETEASEVTPAAVKQQLAAMTPLRRVAVPDDIAGAIAFFASEESRFVTGTSMSVNGGSYMN